MLDLAKNFIEAVEADERRDDFLILNGIAGLTPAQPNDEMTNFVVHYLKKIPIIMTEEHDAAQAMFAVIENLARLFVRTDNKEILDCIEYTKPIVQESYLGDSYLTHIIIEVDTRDKPDRFWTIWNAYKDMLPLLVRMGHSQQLRTYLLNIQWNDGIKEWRCLREQDLNFFSFVGETCEGNAISLECIAKALTNIAHNYQTEGMGWISQIIGNHMMMNLSGTNALFYLEQAMMEYVYANKMQIRSNAVLHEQVRTILNFMVGKSSVTGYVLRDMVN